MTAFDDDIDALAREIEARIRLQTEFLDKLPEPQTIQRSYPTRTRTATRTFGR